MLLRFGSGRRRGTGKRVSYLPNIARSNTGACEPSIPAFRAGDAGPNPARSTILSQKEARNGLICKNCGTVLTMYGGPSYAERQN
ncbi:MAG: hypothetical protein AOA65_2118 [Candidatus Bathyarchaeota archaeon BA1]|nr:MAG: hypothetical protein AOA65_2118 [Candidatus Bathyarchaeota archaeon BA1]